MEFTVSDADELAARLHAGQVDKAGLPYIEHPRAVERLAAGLGGGTDQRIAALLHDVVEDTDCTVEQLAEHGVPEPAVRIVQTMTRRGGEDYSSYLARVVAEPTAVLVKAADVLHNSDPDRLAGLDRATADRLRSKYLTASRTLLAASIRSIPDERLR